MAEDPSLPNRVQEDKKHQPLSLSIFVKGLEASGANIKKIINVVEGGEPFLMSVIHDGNVQIVQYLVEQGADVNKANKHGVTPFLLACQLGNFAIVTYLFSKNADVSIRLKGGFTALMVACNSEHRNKDVVNFLLNPIGVDVNERDDEGVTALMLASQNDDVTIVRNLISAGADVNARAADGTTALDLAKEQGNEKIITILQASRGGRRTRLKKRNTSARRASSTRRRGRRRT